MKKSLLLLALVALFSSACNLTASRPASSSTPEYMASLDEPPPTSGLVANLQSRVKSGEWTLEQGLVLTLKFLAGEVKLKAINPDRRVIEEFEGGGILRLAHGYLREGRDAATKKEIERLLAILMPDPERLRAYSRPAQADLPEASPAVGLLGNLATTSLLAATEDCEDLWRAGFPLDRPVVCFEERVVIAVGQTYRIYVPIEWGDDDPRRAYIEPTAEAIREAVETYSRFAPMPSGTVVFTMMREPEAPDAEAATFMATPGGLCQMAVLPPGLALTDVGFYKFDIAHELFHCFQYRNFFDRRGDWWIEGTPDYFANLVYPTQNYEAFRWNQFDHGSVAFSLLEMDYANEVFFQFLGNQIGNAGILDLISGMPTTPDTGSQRAALAAYPGMEDLFHQFAQDYFDRSIPDTGGGMIASTPRVSEITVIDASRTVTLPVESFKLERARLVFVEGLRVNIREENPGRLRTGAKPRGSGGGWGPLPPELVTVCGEVQYSYLATSASAAGSNPPVELTFDVTEMDGECDPCLVGSWRMDLMSHWNAILPSISASGSAPVLEDIRGEVLATFTADGQMSVRFDDFTIRYHQTIRDIRADGVLRIHGTYASGWFTDRGSGSLYSIAPSSQPVSDGTLTVTFGGSRSTRSISLPAFMGGLSLYQCAGNTLQIDSLTPAGADGDYVTYTRLP